MICITIQTKVLGEMVENNGCVCKLIFNLSTGVKNDLYVNKYHAKTLKHKIQQWNKHHLVLFGGFVCKGRKMLETQVSQWLRF